MEIITIDIEKIKKGFHVTIIKTDTNNTSISFNTFKSFIIYSEGSVVFLTHEGEKFKEKFDEINVKSTLHK